MKCLTLALALVLVGCGEHRPIVQVAANGCAIEEQGHNVFYFRCAAGFGVALAEFRKTHKVISITSYASYNLGTDGYFVIAE